VGRGIRAKRGEKSAWNAPLVSGGESANVVIGEKEVRQGDSRQVLRRRGSHVDTRSWTGGRRKGARFGGMSQPKKSNCSGAASRELNLEQREESRLPPATKASLRSAPASPEEDSRRIRNAQDKSAASPT